MVNFGKKVVKYRVLILILGVLLLIPSVFGYLNTRVNYDVLTYLPDNIETMKGQDILVNDFGTGAFSMFIVDGMEEKDVAELKEKIEKVDHVANVIWYDSIADISVPMSMLPDDIYDVFNSDTGTMMAIFFDEGTSSDGTMDAIAQIRKIAGKQCFFKWNVRSSYGHEESGRKRNSGLCTDCRYFGGHCTWTDNGIIFRTVTFYAEYRNGNHLQSGK